VQVALGARRIRAPLAAAPAGAMHAASVLVALSGMTCMPEWDAGVIRMGAAQECNELITMTNMHVRGAAESSLGGA
jgi:hypothetical protein